jgi:ABC-2 type transport system permease protein
MRVYRRLIGARIRSDLQYRASFVMFTVGQFLAGFIDLVEIVVIFGAVDRLAGWSLPEVAVLYGLTATGFSLADAFVSQVERLPERIRSGTFDQLLIRPLGSLPQLCTDEFELRRFGRIAQGLAVLCVGLARAHVHWTLARAGMLVATIGSGAAIFGSVWVIGSTLAFWTTEATEVMNTTTYGANFLTEYPLGVYPAWARRALLFLPFAFVNYFPALYILGRHDLLGAPAFVRFLSPAVAVGMVALARAAWRFGIRHYQSTGS